MGRAGAWVTAGVAAGVLGGAIATGILGKDLLDDLERTSRPARSGATSASTRQFLYIGSDVGYGIALFWPVSSTCYFLRDPLPDSEGRVLEPRDWALNPYIGPSGAGSHFHVRF